MAEYYVDPENGNDANPGTEAEPWLTLPGMTGANTVAANDIINVKNGTTVAVSGTPFRPPANGLTYRGYGLSSNVLTVRLPATDIQKTSVVRVVRTPGVHEGMWTLNGVGGGVVTVDVQNSRTGVTIEDVLILGETASSINAVTLGTSAAGTQSGVTMRRFEIRGASGKGLSCYKINPLLEWFKISGTVDDCWTIAATATNLYRAGSTDTVRYFELVEPNVNAAGSLVGDSGDGWQTLHASGRFESAITVTEWTLKKTNDVKQAFLLCDCLNGATVSRFHIDSAPAAQSTGLLTCIRGDVVIDRGYWSEGCLNNAVIRLRSSETALSQLLYTGASITICRLVVDSPSGINHFFDAAESTETLEMDGDLVIENCTTNGDLSGGLSYGAMVSLQGGNTTYGANFTLTLRNNLFNSGGAQVRLPTGTAGNSAYSVASNFFGRGSFYIGSTAYGKSDFQAAHSAARGNLAGNPLLGDDMRPMFRSTARGNAIPVLGEDAAGGNYFERPAIGAYEIPKGGGVGNFVQARLALLREQQLELLRKQLEEDSEDLDS